jgi:hypothetical protein
MAVELVPMGRDAANVSPGDFLLCHRRGFVSACIRAGERIKTGKGSVVSHAAFIETAGDDPTLIEALTKGVCRTPLSAYRHVEYWIVRTKLTGDDQLQAVAFAQSCVGDKYGFATDLGIAIRFLTPGKGLWFGAGGTQICSGLVAQTQVRGWVNYPFEPAPCAPSDLFDFYIH